jgi:hypothetical protein
MKDYEYEQQLAPAADYWDEVKFPRYNEGQRDYDNDQFDQAFERVKKQLNSVGFDRKFVMPISERGKLGNREDAIFEIEEKKKEYDESTEIDFATLDKDKSVLEAGQKDILTSLKSVPTINQMRVQMARIAGAARWDA